MKKVIIFLSFVLNLSAQQITWLDTIKYSAYMNVSTINYDHQRHIVVSGSFGASNSWKPEGFFINTYLPSGELVQWDTVSCPFNTNILLGGSAIDSQDNLYICVRSFGRFKYKNMFFEPQTWLIRSNPQGQITGSLSLNYEMPLGLIVDSQDNIYISNLAYGGGSSSVKKFNSFLQLSTIYPEGGQIAFDNSANLYIMNSQLKKYNAQAQLIWTYTGIENYAQFTSDAQGNCYLHHGDGPNGSTVNKINTNGQLLWSVPVWMTATGGISSIGNYIFVSGISGNSQDGKHNELRKLDTNGAILIDTSFSEGSGPGFISTTVIKATPLGLFMGARTNQPVWSYFLKMSDPVLTGSKPQKKELIEFVVSPNPSGGIFNVYCNTKESGAVKLNVTDALGKLVYTKEVRNPDGELSEQINLSGFAKGIYILEIAGGKIRETRRLIVR